MPRHDVPADPGTGGSSDLAWSRARSFLATASSVPEARRWARGELVNQVPAEVLDIAELLLSEIATNAVTHTAGHRIEIQLSLNSHLHIAVHDGSNLPPHLMHPRLVDTGGRGLILVRSLASSWGTRLDGVGKWVWFRVALSRSPRSRTTAPEAPPADGDAR
ncbi:MAG: hypothetical protein QG622_648 [Actinomycetota bacterium]|nr:hypothetical protein [Actinomycetota bacterium]